MRRGNDHRECLRGILSPSNEGTDLLFNPLVRWTIYVPSYRRQLKWRKVGGIMDSLIIDRRSYLTSPSQTPHSMDYILLHIILTEGLILYVISYNPLHHISSCLFVWWGRLIRRGSFKVVVFDHFRIKGK